MAEDDIALNIYSASTNVNTEQLKITKINIIYIYFLIFGKNINIILRNRFKTQINNYNNKIDLNYAIMIRSSCFY